MAGEKLTQYLLTHIGTVLKEPRGFIRYPFIDPGAWYDGHVWDWDTFWCVKALFSVWDKFPAEQQERILRHAEGNVLNLFDHQLPDGYIPMAVMDTGEGEDTYLNLKHQQGVRMNMCKPFLAQQTALICERKGDWSWAAPLADGFRRYMQCYDTYFHADCGLYVWQDDIMIGMDNDPACFGRPPDSTASVLLNGFMVCELEALAALYDAWGLSEEAASVRDRRDALAQAIQRECWDKRDQFFYSVDVDVHTRTYDWFHQGLGVFWNTLPIKIRSWTGFVPLYAGIATKEQAAALAKHCMDEETFLCPGGLCSLARDERMFNLTPSGNPSNWLGAVWLVANYTAFHGLLRYGYVKEAALIAQRSLALLEDDLTETGCLHESYHPFTRKPIMNGGFISWNPLALTMQRELAAYTQK